MKFGPVPLAHAHGAILAHSQTVGGQKLKKGRVLGTEDIDRLAGAGLESVIVARLEPGDIGEDAAADRLAVAVRGQAVTPGAAYTGRANLFAEAPGLALFDSQRLDAFNMVDEAITLATLPAYTPVAPKQMVGTLKVIPFAVPEETVAVAERIAREHGPLLRVAPFRRKSVVLIQTTVPGLKPTMLDKTAEVTATRLAALGSDLVLERRCGHEPGALAEAIAGAAASHSRETAPTPDLVLVVGASAIIDRQDVIPSAIERAGGVVEHFGMPVDPGNLMLLGRLGADERTVPVLGLPGCARAPKLNGFDWVLQRLCADLTVTREDIMRMGAGGLLKEIVTRPLPRAEAVPEPVPPRAPRIGAIVLAAGRSTRMGDTNKLIAPVEGLPMVAHTVDAALLSQADPVLVVTGHEAEYLRMALGDRPVTLVHNPDFAAGLSTSLRAGLSALPEGLDGVVVCLGDMPFVGPHDIDKLIAAYDPDEGREICIPTHDGRRGNPVLLGARFFPAVQGLHGDVGARTLIDLNEDSVCEVPIADGRDHSPGVLTDIDTPEALSALDGTPE